MQRANHFYKTEEEFLYAIADAMKTEYKAIVDAGFIVQIDDPRMVTEYDSKDPAPSPEEYRKFATMRIEALNHALAGRPEDRVRYHMCWGSWHGPHTTGTAITVGCRRRRGARSGGLGQSACRTFPRPAGTRSRSIPWPATTEAGRLATSSANKNVPGRLL